MSRADNERIRRELSCGQSGEYRLSDCRSTVRTIAPKKELELVNLYGVWMVRDGAGYRPATVDEVREMRQSNNQVMT